MLGKGGRSAGWGSRPRAESAAWQFRVERERSAVGRLNDAIAQALMPVVPDSVLRALQVAFDELLTNVIMHAEQAAGPVEIEVRRAGDAIEASIRYVAVEFDPTRWQPDPTVATVSVSRIGGHGIRLVRSLMDDFRYVHDAGVNVVTICKRW